MALGNAADAIEILSAGYILSAFKQEDGSPLSSTQKGKRVTTVLLWIRCSFIIPWYVPVYGSILCERPPLNTVERPPPIYGAVTHKAVVVVSDFISYVGPASNQ